MNEQVWWVLARATGIVAWSLLALAMMWGLLLRSRVLASRATPRWLLDLHRFLGALSLVVVALHLVGLVADSYVHFGVVDILVPFASAWRPAAVALGVLALYLLVGVQATSLLMRLLPRRVWRAVHMTSYLAFLLSTLHMSTAGTDARNVILVLGANLAIAAVLFLVLARLLLPARARGRSLDRRVAAPNHDALQA